MHQQFVGIFPSASLLGGIQVSGREAWKGIAEQIGADQVFLFDYEPSAGKLRAVLSALKNRRKTGTVLIWHLHLLRLVPFLTSASRSVVFLHGIEAWRKLDRVTAWALAKTDLILSNSKYTWKRFVASNPTFRNALHAIVHLGSGDPLPCAVSAPSITPIALMLGRMSRSEDYKGHRQMIGAWPQVLCHLPHAQLWIAGDGDLQPELESLAAQLNLSTNIKFIGRVSDTQKEDLIQQARCFALPSRGEGFGLVYLEAMRAGRPCLISNQDAAREVVDPPHSGIAVDPASPDDIASAAVRLMTDGPEWNSWSASARLRYESYFTAAHFHQRLNNALLTS